MGQMKNKAMEAEAERDAIVPCVGDSCGGGCGARTCQRETRIVAESLEIETRDDSPPRLRGYAAVFNKTTELWPGYLERIAPGAFTRTLKEGADVRALVNHNPDMIIGRSVADPPTLEMSEDAKGLKVSILPPDTQVGRDIVTSIERGDVSQMSFAFRTVKEEIEDKDGVVTRTLVDADLFDVSPVTYPAYPQTSVAVRSLEQWRTDHPVAAPTSESKKPEIDYSAEEKLIDSRRTPNAGVL